MLSRAVATTLSRRSFTTVAARAASASIPSSITFHNHAAGCGCGSCMTAATKNVQHGAGCPCASCGRAQVQTSKRTMMTTVQEAVGATADDALKYSGYSAIDFTISEDATVYDAVQKFAGFNIGCLVTTDAAGACVRVAPRFPFFPEICV